MGRSSGGWESWEWDETLFAGAARHYRQGRTPYAPALADVLADTLGLDGRGRLLDVGCGPGVVALQLAPLFEQVVGLDPDAEMLQEAARLAAAQDVSNATWVQLRAEDLPAGLGRFRVVTFAASFHWMDRPVVAAATKEVLDDGGAVVHVHAPQSSLQPAAEDDIAQLVRSYLGPDRRAGKSVRNTSPDGEDAVFRGAGFAPAQRVMVVDGRVLERSIDDVVANVFSMSNSVPPLFGDRVDAFEADLRALLVKASPSGRFAIELPDNVVDVWRIAA
jgi:SAM-dependent methyltransferase